MARCTHCGINLAKVDPVKVIVQYVREEHDPRGEYRLREWCSVLCRDCWGKKHPSTTEPIDAV